MYFYHLKLDLYPDTTAIPTPPPSLLASSTKPHSPQKQSSQEQGSATSSSSSLKKKSQGQPQQTPSIPSAVTRFRSIFQPFPSPSPTGPKSSTSINVTDKKTFASTVPSSLIASTFAQPTRTVATAQTTERPELDYRLGSIKIASLDETFNEKTTPSSPASNKFKHSKNKKMATAAVSTGGASFQESEPAQGILRLYKDKNEITTGDIHLSSSQGGDKEGVSTSDASPLDREGAQIIHPDHGTAVCVLAVPSYMSPGDFLSFVGPVRSNVSHFRIIR